MKRTTPRRTCTAVLVAVALAILPTSARAQSDADRATARGLFYEARDALDRGDYPKAVDAFTRSDSIVPAPTAKLGLARALVGQKHLVAAHETYARIVREGAPEGAPPAFTAAVEDARAELAALVPRLPHLVVEVRGATGASVTIDGALLPAAALGSRRPVDPGSHTIVATADGRSVSSAVEAVEGRDLPVVLQLEPAVAPIFPIAPAPSPSAAPPPASAAPPRASGEPPSSTRRPLGLGLVGVGGLGLLASAVTGVLYLDAKSTAEDHCTAERRCDEAGLDAVERGRAFGLINTVTLGAGAVLAGTGLVLYLTAPDGEQTLTVAPEIGASAAGASLAARF